MWHSVSTGVTFLHGSKHPAPSSPPKHRPLRSTTPHPTALLLSLKENAVPSLTGAAGSPRAGLAAWGLPPATTSSKATSSRTDHASSHPSPFPNPRCLLPASHGHHTPTRSPRQQQGRCPKEARLSHTTPSRAAPAPGPAFEQGQVSLISS